MHWKYYKHNQNIQICLICPDQGLNVLRAGFPTVKCLRFYVSPSRLRAGAFPFSSAGAHLFVLSLHNARAVFVFPCLFAVGALFSLPGAVLARFPAASVGPVPFFPTRRMGPNVFASVTPKIRHTCFCVLPSCYVLSVLCLLCYLFVIRVFNRFNCSVFRFFFCFCLCSVCLFRFRVYSVFSVCRSFGVSVFLFSFSVFSVFRSFNVLFSYFSFTGCCTVAVCPSSMILNTKSSSRSSWVTYN